MRVCLAAVLAALLSAPAGAAAQTPGAAQVPESRVCTLRVDPGGLTSRDGELLNIHDPFRVICNDGANLRASSGVYDRPGKVVTLTGDVFFEDETRSLTSDRAVYDNAIGMLHATGNVVFADRVEGTTLTGPELEYYRANEQRSEALVNAFGRPRLTLRRMPGAEETDAPGPEPLAVADTSGSPLTIDADRMTIEGRNDLTAVGNVVIEDDDMRAVADEAEQRGSSETLELRGNAAIHSREYSLEAATIFATTPEGTIREVEARRDAKLLGQDLNVEAPQLNLLFEDNLLQRSIARSDEALAPGVQPLATSPTFRLQADSLDASLPGQRLEMVVAIGNARGETIDTTRAAVAPELEDSDSVALRDSTAVSDAEVDPPAAGGVTAMFESGDSVTTVSGDRLVENDWITGDTITGYFATVVSTPVDSLTPEGAAMIASETVDPAVAPAGVADTTMVMERLVALGAARSLYHVAPEAGSPPGTRPGINFLSAAHIELTFVDGQVQVANVDGLRRGLYLEPLAATTDTTESAPGEPGDGSGVDADAAPEEEGEGGAGEAAPDGAAGDQPGDEGGDGD